VYEKAVEGGKSFSVFTKVALLCALTYDRSVELLKDAMAACGKSHVRWLTGWRYGTQIDLAENHPGIKALNPKP
jgi:hypothetical protein